MIRDGYMKSKNTHNPYSMRTESPSIPNNEQEKSLIYVKKNHRGFSNESGKEKSQYNNKIDIKSIKFITNR